MRSLSPKNKNGNFGGGFLLTTSVLARFRTCCSVSRGDLMHFSANSGLASERDELETCPVRRSSILSPTCPESFRGLALIEKSYEQNKMRHWKPKIWYNYDTFGVI